jgi:hypothetical protein
LIRKGNPITIVYYSDDQLLTLPAVTVKTDRDPNTSTPATYIDVYISDIFETPEASLDVIAANCSNGRKQYCDRD